MEPAIGVFAADTTVGVTLEALRTLAKSAVINCAHIVDADEKLLGVITMCEVLFADIDKTLAEVMLTELFTPSPQSPMPDATRVPLNRRQSVYPVCDDSGSWLGLVRAQTVFASETFEITTPAGRMAGVDSEARILIPLMRSFKFGHPWWQLNRSTAFLAGAVVERLKRSIDKFVILAAFLPVLAGRPGKTYCQAMAVTAPAITIGEVASGDDKALLFEEGVLGA